MATKRLGYEGKLYRNTATYATPVWEEIDQVRDVTVTFDADKVEATRRSSGGIKEYFAGLFDLQFEFNMLHDTDDEDYMALLEAAWARDYLDVLALDDDIETPGDKEGYRMSAAIFNSGREENLADNMGAKFTLAPSAKAPPAEKPSRYTETVTATLAAERAAAKDAKLKRRADRKEAKKTAAAAGATP